MASSTNITVQEKLLKFDNLLQGLELLTEEIRTRKDLVLTDEHLQTMFEESLTEDRILNLAAYIVNRMGQTTIVNSVARQVKDEIEKHIDYYIASQLEEPSIGERIERLIAARSSGSPAPSNHPQEKSFENLTYDSVEDIAARFRGLAERTA